MSQGGQVVARIGMALGHGLWSRIGVPVWEGVVATTSWRRARHAARVAASVVQRCVPRVVHRRDAWWISSVQYRHAMASGAAPTRFLRAHRYGCKRRWDAYPQEVADSHDAAEWQSAVQYRSAWEALEFTLSLKYGRPAPRVPSPRGQRVVEETQP